MPRIRVAVTRTSTPVSKCSINCFSSETLEKIRNFKWVFSEQLRLSALSIVKKEVSLNLGASNSETSCLTCFVCQTSGSCRSVSLTCRDAT